MKKWMALPCLLLVAAMAAAQHGQPATKGAAAGAVMIGEAPRTRAFEQQFDWPDAVIELPFGSDSIDALMNELDEQPDRQNEIRRSNVVQALMRHDWAYRWETVLKVAGLEPMPALLERKERLGKLAQECSVADL